MSTIAQILDNHVTLTVESFDRLLLNGFVQKLQTGGQLVTFLRDHRGNPIPSPALLNRMGDKFKENLADFTSQLGLTMVTFEPKQRKDDIAKVHLNQFTDAEGVYMIGKAQEKCFSFKALTNHAADSPLVSVSYSRQLVFVNQYYFYLFDDDFGPGFIKVNSYAPYGIKVCINGHEWAKRQLIKRGIGFAAIDNGFRSCDDPAQLQEICDSLSPSHVFQFFMKWLDRLPLPLTPEDRAAGYDYSLSIKQAEFSRTQVFDNPTHGRQFFEEIIRENIDIGRPDRVSLIFDRAVIKTTPGDFSTRIIQHGVHPSLHFRYKSCDGKQYFKENAALRSEVTFNNLEDFRIAKDISHLPELRDLGRDINRRLLEVERVSQACTLDQDTVETITHPTVTPDGQRAPALRLSDPRAMAIWQALPLMCHLPQGFTNAQLRTSVEQLSGPDIPYTRNSMSYDLRRLKLKGLIVKIRSSHRYTLTSLGLKAALFFSKLHARIFKPGAGGIAARDGIPRALTDAFEQVQLAIDQLVEGAKIGCPA